MNSEFNSSEIIKYNSMKELYKGEKYMECKECCRDISEEEYDKNNGYCKKCYSNFIEPKLKEIINTNEEEYEKEYDEEEYEKEYDEEYEKEYEKEYDEEDKEKKEHINLTAKIIKAIAILGGILGAIAGLVLLSDDEEIGILYLMISVIFAILINGFGEIIQLLEDIYWKIH